MCERESEEERKEREREERERRRERRAKVIEQRKESNEIQFIL